MVRELFEIIFLLLTPNKTKQNKKRKERNTLRTLRIVY
jgi:hypothetical protein